jgi:PAS domain S-box-containing protein
MFQRKSKVPASAEATPGVSVFGGPSALQQAILDSVNYAVMATGLDGTIRSFNAAAERILGYRADEVVGKANATIAHDAAELERRAERLTRELRTEVEPSFQVLAAKAFLGNADESEWTYIRKDGSRLPALISVTPLRGGDGAVEGFAVIGQDITERKKIERMKDEFISTVSHELRTPLTAIIGSLGLIRNGATGKLSDKGVSMIDIAIANSDRLMRLINDILDIEKIERGDIEFDKEPLDPQALVDEAINVNRAYSEQYEVTFEAGERLSGAVIEACPDALMQVLTNLLSNAAKFSPAGGVVTVDVNRHDGAVRVSVTDRGPGISDDFRGHVFEKFAQADSSDTRQKGGTGLGLSICKAIVDKHDGRIWFESQPGKGTTFYFELAEQESASDAAPDIALDDEPPARQVG